jgi:hypothetical protein
MELEIITDHKWKQFKYGYEVPAKVMADQFSHMDKETQDAGFLQYRGYWYHLSDFMRINKNAPFGRKWNGYLSDTFFSGILIEVSEDGETYRVGRYYS